MSVRGQRRRPRWVVVSGVLLIGVGVGASAWWRRPASAESTTEARDVPREDHGAVTISDAYRARAGIRFCTVRRDVLAPVVKVVGTVTLDPRRVTAVGTRTAGFVRRIYKLQGDDVKAGQALAEVESADLGQAQAKVAAAQAEQNAASLNARREAALLNEHLTTARESEAAAATLASREAELAAARQGVSAMGGEASGPMGLRVLRSPIAGHVVEAALSVGQSVEPHKLAFRVANLDWVWVELEVFERTISLVHVGDPVEVTPVADSNRKIEGSVAHVGELIDRASRSADVRIQVDNRARLLRPGQAVSALIRLSGPGREAVTVPASAVTYVDDAPMVFVAATPNRIIPTKVRLGLTDGNYEEILSGLSEGSRVVEEGVFAIKSELFR